MSDARERLIEAGERVLDRYPSGGLLARLLLDCWTSEGYAPDLRAVLGSDQVMDYDEMRAKAQVFIDADKMTLPHAWAEYAKCVSTKDGARRVLALLDCAEELDDAVALLRDYDVARVRGRTEGAVPIREWNDLRRAFLARIEGSDK